jgi:uncharacterized protein YecE (DUF72 family)
MKLSEYFDRFRMVEVQESFFDPPGDRTLLRWRRQAPEGFAFTILAWQLITHPPTYGGYRRIRRSWDRAAGERFGSFQPTEQTRWAWEATERAARILDARAIVFRTPASFTPTRRNRENLERFFASVERGPCHLVWEPDGMWQEPETGDLCEECGLILSVDPLVSKPVPGRAFYFRMREKTRGRDVYTEDDFSEICGLASDAQEEGGDGFFVWQTPDAARDAMRFQRRCAG